MERKTFGRSRRTRRGLTLMELVVVMVILVALAGMVIPLFPNLIGRAQTSAGATNLGEVAKAVQMYYNLNNNQYPNNLDSVVSASGVATYVPNPTSAPAGSGGNTTTTPDLAAYTLSASDYAALAAVGITSLTQMIENPTAGTLTDWNPTFFPYGSSAAGTGGTTGVTFAPLSGASVAALNPTAAYRVFGVPQVLSSTAATGLQGPTYVVFGLGKYSAMSGTSMSDAPVLFNTASGYDPNTVYARVGLVFQTADANGPLTTTNRNKGAQFIGAIEFSQYGVRTVGSDLQMNYSMK